MKNIGLEYELKITYIRDYCICLMIGELSLYGHVIASKLIKVMNLTIVHSTWPMKVLQIIMLLLH